MTELLERLTAVAAVRAQTTPEVLLATIRNLESSGAGLDWTDFVPEEIADEWNSLSAEARLVAFIIAVHQEHRSMAMPDRLI